MSDDEEITYVKRQKIIHYGSLEEQERQKLIEKEKLKDEESDDEKDGSDDDDSNISKDISSIGIVNVSDGLFHLYYFSYS